MASVKREIVHIRGINKNKGDTKKGDTKCDICGKRYIYKYGLGRHERGKHSGKRIKCDKCSEINDDCENIS